MKKAGCKNISKHLLAIDPGLTCSGWALFRLTDGKLIAIGKVKSIAANNPLFHRLDDLQEKISGIMSKLKLSKGDILVCEAPTTMRDPKAAIKVEQVRGIFEVVARSREVLVPGRINPRSVQYEIMGLGGRQLDRQTVKSTAIRVVKTLFGTDLEDLGFSTGLAQLKKYQDIVDAVLIGNLAVSRVQAGMRTGVDVHALFESSATRFSKQALKERKEY